MANLDTLSTTFGKRDEFIAVRYLDRCCLGALGCSCRVQLRALDVVGP